MSPQWHTRRLGDDIKLSNPKVPLEEDEGIMYRKNFLEPQEITEILHHARQCDFEKEGFEQKRRVRKYTIEDPGIPAVFQSLVRRLGLPATHISIYEFESDKHAPTGESASQYTVTTFESRAKESGQYPYFVAYIPLSDVIHHVHQPVKRQPICWRLASDNHWTDILTEAGSLLLKRHHFLEHWRGRVRPLHGSAFILKLYNLPDESTATFEDDFGYNHAIAPSIPRGPFPSLENVLTIVITTSPVRSNPSTELLERTIETFVNAGPDFLRCPKVIVCDGYRKKTAQTSKKHGNVKQQMRNGLVDDDQADNYHGFKENLKALCMTQDEDSPFFNTTVEELEERHGYGFALRHALQNCVKTEYVCVIQHDRTFMRPTPVRETVHAMWVDTRIKYVGMSMQSNLMYGDIAISKYGKHFQDSFEDMVLQPAELCLDARAYGPGSDGARQIQIKRNLDECISNYGNSTHAAALRKRSDRSPAPTGKAQLSLVPTLYWYDNTHIVETKHYRDFIFNDSYRMVSRGGFVEDKCSPVLIKTLERLGLTEGHSRYGCYILDDQSGIFFTGHLDGGTFLTSSQRADRIKMNEAQDQ